MTPEDIYAIVVRHTLEVMPELGTHTFARSDRLQDLGANSVDRAEIVNLVLETLGLRIARVDLFGPRNIGELASVLHGKLHAG
ncbi:MAG TPA: acyl carrier protein [Steroidobacteraceae bacterium]|jgi:polyketide biosynthesis acyl carrier protein